MEDHASGALICYIFDSLLRILQKGWRPISPRIQVMTHATVTQRQAFFQQHGIRDVECIFPDISGYPRGKLMPANTFAAGGELRICQAIPMQAVTGDYSYNPIFPDSDPDVRLVPDYSTLKLSPWASAPRAVAIHDCVELDGRLCEFAPRSILKKQMARLADDPLPESIYQPAEAAIIRYASDHPVLAKVLRDEPEVIGPFLASDLPEVIARITSAIAPLLGVAMASSQMGWIGSTAHSCCSRPTSTGVWEVSMSVTGCIARTWIFAFAYNLATTGCSRPRWMWSTWRSAPPVVGSVTCFGIFKACSVCGVRQPIGVFCIDEQGDELHSLLGGMAARTMPTQQR